MRRFGIGQSITRVEDRRFLTGVGCYTDDMRLTGQAYGWVVRSLYPHADITLDAGSARAMPGVLLVLTPADLAADGIGPMRTGFMPAGQPEPQPRAALIRNPRAR